MTQAPKASTVAMKFVKVSPLRQSLRSAARHTVSRSASSSPLTAARDVVAWQEYYGKLRDKPDTMNLFYNDKVRARD
jgi:hypothetical protein